MADSLEIIIKDQVQGQGQATAANAAGNLAAQATGSGQLGALVHSVVSSVLSQSKSEPQAQQAQRRSSGLPGWTSELLGEDKGSSNASSMSVPNSLQAAKAFFSGSNSQSWSGATARAGASAASVGSAAGGATAGGLGSVAALAAVAGPLALAGSIFVGAVTAATHALNNMAHPLAPFSGQVSAALARGEQRSVNDMFRRDAVAGGNASRFVDSSSRLDSTVSNIYTYLTTYLEPPISAILETLNTGLKFLELILAAMNATGIPTVLGAIASTVGYLQKKVSDGIDYFIGKDKPEGYTDLGDIIQDALTGNRFQKIQDDARAGAMAGAPAKRNGVFGNAPLQFNRRMGPKLDMY